MVKRAGLFARRIRWWAAMALLPLLCAAGMDDYLAKPVDLATLASVLGRWSAPPDGYRG